MEILWTPPPFLLISPVVTGLRMLPVTGRQLAGLYPGVLSFKYRLKYSIDEKPLSEFSYDHHGRKPYYHNAFLRGFPGGTVVKSPPANAGDMGSSPGPEGSHMPRCN